MLCLSCWWWFCVMPPSHSKLMHTHSETVAQKNSEILPNLHVPIQSDTWYFSLYSSLFLSFLGCSLPSSFFSIIPIFCFQLGQKVIRFLFSIFISALGEEKKHQTNKKTNPKPNPKTFIFLNTDILLQLDSYIRSWNVLNREYKLQKV